MKFYHDVFELLCQHFTAIEPTSLSGNFNLYCGAAMLLLVPLYLLIQNTAGRQGASYPSDGFPSGQSEHQYADLCVAWISFSERSSGKIFIYLYFSGAVYGIRRLEKPEVCAEVDGSGFCSGLACLSRLLLVGAEGGTGNIYLGSHYRCDSDLCRLIDGSPAGTEKRRIVELLLMFVILIEACGYGTFGLCMNGTVNRKRLLQ